MNRIFKGINLFLLLFIVNVLTIRAFTEEKNSDSTQREYRKKTVTSIICPLDAPSNIKLAAREIRRYIYLRTGTLLPVVESADGNKISFSVTHSLGEQQFRLKSDGRSMEISGGTDVAVLYGVYAFAEKMGIWFQIDGDVIPDSKITFRLPELDETHQPLFRLRGLQPFHDFPEGPDWWTKDDWKVVAGQAVKMRMNFIGLHTYPFRNKDLGPEPTVWIGLPEDVNKDGTVKIADISSWYSTAKFIPYGCYAPGKTSSFSFGAAQLFAGENYGPEINGPDDIPFPKTPEACVSMSDRVGQMLNDVFTEARKLGIRIAVGTESPLDIPDVIQNQLKARGLNSSDPSTIQKLYEGMFLRIKRTYPIDYYWIWGHEGDIDEKLFISNIEAARAALKTVNAPFSLGICGWGWTAGHFPVLDRALPEDVFFSAISHNIGNDPVSPNFGKLNNRLKFAIPWAEDDGNLTAFQFWVGRMRRDAVDAYNYGCDGLFCLHWRTHVINPNLSAIAEAGWAIGNWRKPEVQGKLPRSLSSDDFYKRWAIAQFGPEVAGQAAPIFTKLDCNFPHPSTWKRGPGEILINKLPWSQVKSQYTFTEEMEALRPLVRGKGNLARFDWWCHEFYFMRYMAELGCARGELDAILERLKQTEDASVRRTLATNEAVPLRLKMKILLEKMYEHLLATINNSSELGTITNIELQSLLRCKLLTAHDDSLEKMAGMYLPPEAMPSKDYKGDPLLVNLTVRTSQKAGESIKLRIIALDKKPVKTVMVRVRALGKGKWKTVNAENVANAVWEAVLPGSVKDFEYQIVSENSAGAKLIWPSTAPEINQTVVISE